jgi:hypothetical protein
MQNRFFKHCQALKRLFFVSNVITMKKTKNMPVTITISIEAYRKIGELSPNQKQTETIRNLLEAICFYNGNFFELLALISNSGKT